MVEIQRTTFEVTPTGVGRPDYSPQVAASHLITDGLQTRYSYPWRETIAAGGTTNFNTVAVASGFKLNIGLVIVTCEASIIQTFDLMVRRSSILVRTILDKFPFDMEGKIVYGPDNAIEVDAGENLSGRLYNNDIVDREFTALVQGFLEIVYSE